MRTMKWFAAAFAICVVAQIHAAPATATQSRDESDRYPKDLNDLVVVLMRWDAKNRGFLDQADGVFESESSAPWSLLMERKVTEFGSTHLDAKLLGECRTDLCRYTVTLDGRTLPEELFHALGSALIWNNSDGEPASVYIAHRLVGPNEYRAYIFRAWLPTEYLEPMRQRLGEHY